MSARFSRITSAFVIVKPPLTIIASWQSSLNSRCLFCNLSSLEQKETRRALSPGKNTGHLARTTFDALTFRPAVLFKLRLLRRGGSEPFRRSGPPVYNGCNIIILAIEDQTVRQEDSQHNIIIGGW